MFRIKPFQEIINVRLTDVIRTIILDRILSGDTIDINEVIILKYLKLFLRSLQVHLISAVHIYKLTGAQK